MHGTIAAAASLLIGSAVAQAPAEPAPKVPAPAYTVPYKIVTASERGTYIQIGRDLATWIAEPAGIELEVLESKGSAENIQRMRFEPGVKLALVQSDVYQAFLDEAKAGNAEAGNIIRPLRLTRTALAALAARACPSATRRAGHRMGLPPVTGMRAPEM